MKNHFHLANNKPDNSSILLTIFISDNLTNSAEYIQENVLQNIHQISKWYDVEIVGNGPKYIFDSYEICHQNNCTRKFVAQYKTKYYFMVINGDASILNILKILKNSKSFNPLAFCLIYLSSEAANYEEIIKNTLTVLFSNLFAYCAVLFSVNDTLSHLYQLNVQTEGPAKCASNKTLYVMDKCVNGEYFKHHNILFLLFFSVTSQKDFFTVV